MVSCTEAYVYCIYQIKSMLNERVFQKLKWNLKCINIRRCLWVFYDARSFRILSYRIIKTNVISKAIRNSLHRFTEGVCLSACLSACLSIRLSVCLSVWWCLWWSWGALCWTRRGHRDGPNKPPPCQWNLAWVRWTVLVKSLEFCDSEIVSENKEGNTTCLWQVKAVLNTQTSESIWEEQRSRVVWIPETIVPTDMDDP